jgi:hypothetical protein
MNQEQAKGLITINGEFDQLETTITIHTHRVQPDYRGSSFLRCFITKKTNEKNCQVYASSVHKGDWHHYHSANYSSNEKTISVKTLKIDSDVKCDKYGCTYYETVAFEIPYQTIIDIGSTYKPFYTNRWRYLINWTLNI